MLLIIYGITPRREEDVFFFVSSSQEWDILIKSTTATALKLFVFKIIAPQLF